MMVDNDDDDGDDDDDDVLVGVCKNQTCHRSRNLRPTCSSRDPEPRRCTAAP